MSHPNLSVTEVIDIARRLEAIGEGFYDEAARHVRTAEARKLLKWLAREEERHAVVFERVLQRLGSLGADGDWRVDEHYLAYLTTLAQSHVFPTVESARQRAAELQTDEAVICQALLFERASVAFFEALSERLAPADQAVIGELVAEEHRHIAALEAHLERGRAAR